LLVVYSKGLSSSISSGYSRLIPVNALPIARSSVTSSRVRLPVVPFGFAAGPSPSVGPRQLSRFHPDWLLTQKYYYMYVEKVAETIEAEARI